MTSLRDLCQAVVDAPDDDAARVALGRWLGFPRGADPSMSVAVDILAAITEAEERGYARALGDVDGLLKREAQSAVDKARSTNDPIKEGYSMAVRDMRVAVGGLARAASTPASAAATPTRP